MPVSEGDIISLAYLSSIAITTSEVIGTSGSFYETYLHLKILN